MGGKPEAKERHDGRARVGEVVERVGGNCDGAGERAREKLPREQQEIQKDAHRAAQNAVGRPNRWLVGGLPVFDKELCQKPYHAVNLLFRRTGP